MCVRKKINYKTLYERLDKRYRPSVHGKYMLCTGETDLLGSSGKLHTEGGGIVQRSRVRKQLLLPYIIARKGKHYIKLQEIGIKHWTKSNYILKMIQKQTTKKHTHTLSNYSSYHLYANETEDLHAINERKLDLHVFLKYAHLTGNCMEEETLITVLTHY